MKLRLWILDDFMHQMDRFGNQNSKEWVDWPCHTTYHLCWQRLSEADPPGLCIYREEFEDWRFALEAVRDDGVESRVGVRSRHLEDSHFGQSVRRDALRVYLRNALLYISNRKTGGYIRREYSRVGSGTMCSWKTIVVSLEILNSIDRGILAVPTVF